MLHKSCLAFRPPLDNVVSLPTRLESRRSTDQDEDENIVMQDAVTSETTKERLSVHATIERSGQR